MVSLQDGHFYKDAQGNMFSVSYSEEGQLMFGFPVFRNVAGFYYDEQGKFVHADMASLDIVKELK